MKKTQTSVHITPEVKAAAVKDAKSRGVTLSALIEQLLRKQLKMKGAVG